MREMGTVAWSDTDASGWIHFTAPQRWAENAEHGLCRRIAPGVEIRSFPRREVSASFQRPLRPGDAFEVDIRPERVGTTSITYAWQVSCDDEVCVDGRHTVNHVDDDGRPAPVPAALRTGLVALIEGTSL